MSILKKVVGLALTMPLTGGFVPLAAHADPEPECFYESRRGVQVECGIYKGEISNSKAYVDTVVNNNKPWTWKSSRKAVLLDVRSLQEYKAGHPENAYNVPYPYIHQYCDEQGRHPDGACKKSVGQDNQTLDDFIAYVEKIIPNKNTPIYTLCRTGSRSVGAANRLTEAGYENVYNMWEGFVGVYLQAPIELGQDPEFGPVDLNHDGVLNDLDKNGWIYHGGMPYSKSLLPHLVYRPAFRYYWYD
jgi:rhodanese-related sulfurtransferase